MFFLMYVSLSSNKSLQCHLSLPTGASTSLPRRITATATPFNDNAFDTGPDPGDVDPDADAEAEAGADVFLVIDNDPAVAVAVANTLFLSFSLSPGETIQIMIPAIRGPVASVGKVWGDRTIS